MADELMTLAEAVRRLQSSGVSVVLNPSMGMGYAEIHLTPEMAAFALADRDAFLAQHYNLSLEDFHLYMAETAVGEGRCLASTAQGHRCQGSAGENGVDGIESWSRAEQRCPKHRGMPEHPSVRAAYGAAR